MIEFKLGTCKTRVIDEIAQNNLKTTEAFPGNVRLFSLFLSTGFCMNSRHDFME